MTNTSQGAAHDSNEAASMGCHVSSRTGRASRAFHMDYHWDRPRSYLRTSLTLVASLLSCVVSCDVWVMCHVALFCVVPRPSDTRITVLGFVTRSMFGRSFKAALYLYINCVHEKENLRFDFLNHSTCLLRSDRLRRCRALRSPCPTSSITLRRCHTENERLLHRNKSGAAYEVTDA
jgi:hypothetical protein